MATECIPFFNVTLVSNWCQLRLFHHYRSYLSSCYSNSLFQDIFGFKTPQEPNKRPSSTASDTEWQLGKFYVSSKFCSRSVLRLPGVFGLLLAQLDCFGCALYHRAEHRSEEVCNPFMDPVFFKFIFESCYLLLEDETRSTCYREHTTTHRSTSALILPITQVIPRLKEVARETDFVK